MKAIKSISAGAVMLLGLTLGAPSAFATETAGAEVLDALGSVQATAGSDVVAPLTGNAVPESPVADGQSTVVVTPGAEVELPASSTDPLRLTETDGTTTSVTLPKSTSGAESTAISGDVVGYDNRDGSHTIPVVKLDGSVQITTVIDGPSAPSTYAYEFNLPQGATMQQEGAGVLFVTSDGSSVGGVAPAWAVDAKGAAVQTRYEISGSTLTQVVEHGPDTAYPVVADPLWGTDLIQSAQWINRGGVVSLSLVPTGWNRFNANFGPAITEGWKEALAKTPSSYVNGRWYTRSSASTEQMYWQYNCHQVLAFAKGEWNLEPSTYRSSYASYSFNLCN